MSLMFYLILIPKHNVSPSFFSFFLLRTRELMVKAGKDKSMDGRMIFWRIASGFQFLKSGYRCLLFLESINTTMRPMETNLTHYFLRVVRLENLN